ncbi:MAG: hypothetical protein J7L45_01070 [Candidatus Aenigmarchaeota archaeon]|nr:hypothetical protein [Candidatus Aenigmarchaeota archaeon]
MKLKSVYGISLGFLVLLVFALTFSMTIPKAGAAVTNATDQISVSVNISAKCIVDVSPSSLVWSTPLDPGSVGERKDVQIENLGSVNITHVWFNNSYPSTRPFGTAVSSNYDSGNWIAISVDTDGQPYYFPNRVDYNESQRVVYLTGSDGNTPPQVPYGRFRNSSYEYFWDVEAGACGNYTCGTFYIGTSPHTKTQTGDVDLSDNTGTTLTSIGNWGYAAITVGSENLCVAMYHDGSKAMFYKWNMDAPGAESCSNAAYFVGSSNSIVPGASAYARVRVFVPYGVYYNATNPTIPGTLTVLANTVA